MATNIKDTLSTLGSVNNLGFVPFTTSLIHGVFNSIVASSITQMKSYAELVALVSKSLNDFMDVEIGADRPAAVMDTIKNGFGVTVPAGNNPDLTLTSDQIADLKATFFELRSGNKSFEELVAATPGKIKLDKLKDFVTQKLEKDASEKYEFIKTLVKLGMQKVVVDRGLIRTKLTFHVAAREQQSRSRFNRQVNNESSTDVILGNRTQRSAASTSTGGGVFVDQNSELLVNVVNERSSSASNVSASIIGEVVIEFRTDSFPVATI